MSSTHGDNATRAGGFIYIGLNTRITIGQHLVNRDNYLTFSISIRNVSHVMLRLNNYNKDRCTFSCEIHPR